MNIKTKNSDKPMKFPLSAQRTPENLFCNTVYVMFNEGK